MDNLKLTNERLSVDEALKVVTAPNCGAVSLFVGTTRDNFEGKKVLQLEYEAYESMAYKALQKICIEMRDKWKNIENIAIHHRLGVVPVSESSVVIAISSPHRADALEATQWCIDTLKKTVPIWKKEIYENSTPEWKENSECQWSKKIKEFKQNENLQQIFPIQNNIVPSHLIQITCSSSDMNKRIQNFMERKREQANLMNIRDFCGNRSEEGCARTTSMLVKNKNSKTHLKVGRVFNTYGPRSKLKDCSPTKRFIPNASNPIEERLKTLEENFNISKPIPKDVYTRLKRIEDRLLELEAISPEYAQFWKKSSFFEPQKMVEKQNYSIDDVDRLLLDLETRNIE